MAATLASAHDAHYHAIAATAAWATFRAAQTALAVHSSAERAGRDRERERETTYARGELGGH
jgi:hypothetical protein